MSEPNEPEPILSIEIGTWLMEAAIAQGKKLRVRLDGVVEVVDDE